MPFQRLRLIQNTLNNNFYDRETEVEALLIALLARQHILFIGPAGTGKSALSAMLGEIVEGAHYFQHLLTPFSTPEELFGVLSLKDLEQGVYKRNIKDMLPTAHFAFIDEIFKANSAILNCFLTLINERRYYNNGVPIESPLVTLVGSSNEYIESNEGLEALFDRFLLRYEVGYIRDDSSFISMLRANHEQLTEKLSLHELYTLQAEVKLITINDEIYRTLAKIRRQLKVEGIRPSDRRFKQSLSILQAKAFLLGRTEVHKSDLNSLTNVLWETPDQKQTTIAVIQEIVSDSIELFINRIVREFDDVIQSIETIIHSNMPNDRAKLSELLMRGKSLFMEVQTMNRQSPKTELMVLKNDMHKRLLQMTSDVIGF